MLFQLAFEPLEQGEGIRRRPGKPGDHLAIADAPHLAGIGLHDGVAHGNLAIARDHGAAVLLHPDDGGAVPLDQAVARLAVVHGRDMGSRGQHSSGRGKRVEQAGSPEPPSGYSLQA
jgi:hypothetical protein